MNPFHRKNKWQRLAGKATSYTTKNSTVRTGTAAVAGLVTATAASAAVSARRRKSGS